MGHAKILPFARIAANGITVDQEFEQSRVELGMHPKPLSDIRVLDVSHVIAGPFCTMLLANAGAEVLKIEPPKVGERSRNSGHAIPNEGDEPVTLQYVRVNRGKKGLTLNLQSDSGKALFKSLVKVSDVVVENFRPGTMKRLGLDYEVLRHVNPGLVYATISGYGRLSDLAGPYSDWPANNPSAQAMSGIMDVTGEPGAPPSLVGASVGDTIPALWTAYGIMLALAQRRQTGKGQHVDISMYDCLLLHNDVAVPYYNLYGKVSGRNREDMWSAQLRLEAADGFVVISGSVPRESWTKLWRAAGRDDLSLDPKYLGHKIDGPFLIKVVRPALEVWTKTQRKEELCRFLLGLGFSAAMVQTARDVFDCPHLEARQMFHEFDFLGKHYRLPGDPVKLSEAPSAEGSAPPSLGQDNADMFRKLLGISEAEIREYQALGVM